MKTVPHRKTLRVLLAPGLMIAAMMTAPSALANCACLCVDGAPYNVCTSFLGQTHEVTADCTTQLADSCPTPETPTGTDSPVQNDALPPPVNAAAQENGLECKPRQVYRPDLAEYKVYTVCMPQASETGQARATAGGGAATNAAGKGLR